MTVKEKSLYPTAKSLRRCFEQPDEDALSARIFSLHNANSALWSAEDAVRDRSIAAVETVALKRDIDRLNLERHAAIHSVDTWFDERFSPKQTLDSERVVLNSESVGQMLDRLSIVELKVRHYTGVGGAQPHLAARAALLCRCIDRVLEALASGNALPQRFDEAKTYGA